MRSNFSRNLLNNVRDGFTLIELIIAVGILLILTTMTVAVYTTTASADRIRSSARQVQSAFGGARDRGLKAWKENALSRRGLRLLVDAADPTTVSAMTYIGSEDYWEQGFVLIGRPDNPGGVPDGYADSDVIQTIRGYGTGWRDLYRQGLLVDGARIQIPKGQNGGWYTVNTYYLESNAGGPEILILKSDYRNTSVEVPINPVNPMPPVPPNPAPVGTDGKPGVAGVDDDSNGTDDDGYEVGWPGSDDMLATDMHAFRTAVFYRLELQPSILPSQEPLRLSSGIAIDLFNSSIPPGWYHQVTLPKGSAPPATDKDAAGNINYWGAWGAVGTDPSNTSNDLYRQYSPRMDIMFSPQGTVSGATAAYGPLHLRLAEVEDITLRRSPSDQEAAPMLYCTLFPLTGFVGTFPVNLTGDPLKFAKMGAVAGR